MAVRKFKTGAVRDDDSGKFDIGEYISPLALGRFYEHMRKSALKYGAGNWRKGIPYEEAIKSLRRHLWVIDMAEHGVVLEKETDHFAALLFNVMIAIDAQERERFTKVKSGEKIYGYDYGS